LNPGSHAPQACILIHARRRPHGDTCFSKELNEVEQAVIKTLTFLRKNGKAEHTIKQVDWQLKFLGRRVDIFDSEAVKTYIALAKR
jgi:hypothetical protein